MLKVSQKLEYAMRAMIELAQRPVLIHAIDVLAYEFPFLDLRIRCGKGTYIRSLARDLGLALTGHAGSLAGLRRTAIGAFRVDNAVRLDDLPDHITQTELSPVPGITLDATEAAPPPTT